VTLLLCLVETIEIALRILLQKSKIEQP
jgi:hypothetical protein